MRATENLETYENYQEQLRITENLWEPMQNLLWLRETTGMQNHWEPHEKFIKSIKLKTLMTLISERAQSFMNSGIVSAWMLLSTADATNTQYKDSDDDSALVSWPRPSPT